MRLTVTRELLHTGELLDADAVREKGELVTLLDVAILHTGELLHTGEILDVDAAREKAELLHTGKLLCVDAAQESSYPLESFLM